MADMVVMVVAMVEAEEGMVKKLLEVVIVVEAEDTFLKAEMGQHGYLEAGVAVDMVLVEIAVRMVVLLLEVEL